MKLYYTLHFNLIKKYLLDYKQYLSVLECYGFENIEEEDGRFILFAPEDDIMGVVALTFILNNQIKLLEGSKYYEVDIISRTCKYESGYYEIENTLEFFKKEFGGLCIHEKLLDFL